MTIIGIDPGNTHTAFAVIECESVKEAHYLTNKQALHWLMGAPPEAQVVCEMIASYGMPVGKTVFDTCVFIGALWATRLSTMKFVTRIQVKSTICHSAKAKDANVRQALIDRYGPQGTKKQPGPTYGLSGDMWAALAAATAYADGAKLYSFGFGEEAGE